MAYKLSKRHEQDAISAKNNASGKLDFGKLATVFIVCGLISLLTAWFYSMETEQLLSSGFAPNASGVSAELGPLHVKKYHAVYSIKIKADLPSQSWSHIEGQVLDSNKDYLFAFGKELSYYSGRDWSERDEDYTMSVTFPKPGIYYIQFSSESNKPPRSINVAVSKKRGSSLPHLWFGMITLVVGIVLNEIRNRTIMRTMQKFES